MTRAGAAALGLVLLLVLLLGGCGDPASQTEPAPTPTPTSTPATARPTPSPRPSAEPDPTQRPPRPRPLLGVDVSHHQGSIEWRRVAGDGIAFAYLKATEGSTFTDPQFATNHRAADAAGLRVGGYHYYSLCSGPESQADHFTATLASVGPAARPLPPVVDLELIGNCDPPPDRATLLADVRVFVARVERTSGRRVVVYTHPDLDAAYGPTPFADRLDRRRWVRRPGDEPPAGAWWIWQRADDARVAGVDGPVDLDVMRPPSRTTS